MEFETELDIPGCSCQLELFRHAGGDYRRDLLLCESLKVFGYRTITLQSLALLQSGLVDYPYVDLLGHWYTPSNFAAGKNLVPRDETNRRLSDGILVADTRYVTKVSISEISEGEWT